MKRSEAFALLKAKLEIAQRNQATSELTSILLLDEMERIGMLPPGYTVARVDGNAVMQHEWEKEEEAC